MEKINKAIEILQAYKEGKTIEYKVGTNGVWSDLIGIPYRIFDEAYHFKIKPEPKYRPYANVEEFLKDSKVHGPYIKFNEGVVEIPTLVNKLGKDEPWRIECTTLAYNRMCFGELVQFQWQDGSPCGILE